jgi:hypothetical protein
VANNAYNLDLPFINANENELVKRLPQPLLHVLISQPLRPAASRDLPFLPNSPIRAIRWSLPVSTTVFKTCHGVL